MDEIKKRRRKRRSEGWVVALSCLTAVGVVGAFVPLAVRQAGGGGEHQEAVSFPAPDWLAPAEARAKARGFDWLSLAYGGGIVTVNGDAPSQTAADTAFAAAQAAIAAQSAPADTIVVNNIAIAGAEAVGAAFAQLGATPDVPACQGAFADTLAGRFVGFEVGSARITRDSAQLLDALAAVAKRCEAHRIEIAGHTDLSGSPSRNLLLSEDRATAVRNYFVEQGVSAETLSAAGFGDTRPLDPARTPEADARNRRIEFTVRGV